jgi:uncharacterized membrane protein
MIIRFGEGAVDMMGGFEGCCGFGWFGNLGGWGWIGFVLYLLILIAILIGIVAFIFWLVRRIRANGPSTYSPTTAGNTQSSAQEILAIRYARGEIDREKFKSLLSDLE